MIGNSPLTSSLASTILDGLPSNTLLVVKLLDVCEVNQDMPFTDHYMD